MYGKLSNGLAKADDLTNNLANDNEIIKALECCLCADTVMECHECTYIGENNCLNSMITDVLDLINRQQAEIKRLKEDNEYILMQHKFDRRPNGDCWNDVIKKAKSEAIREFAERLKNKSRLLAPSVYAEPFRAVSVEEIDNLVAEMTEDNNAE